MFSPNRLRTPRTTVLATAVAALSIGLLSEVITPQDVDDAVAPNVTRIPKRDLAFERTTVALTPEQQAAMTVPGTGKAVKVPDHITYTFEIPRQLPKHHKSSARQRAFPTPESPEQFPAVHPDEFVNINFEATTRDVAKQYKTYGCGKNVKIVTPYVPLYTKDAHGQAVAVEGAWYPGDRHIYLSPYDMPPNTQLWDSPVYAFMNNKAFQLHVGITEAEVKRNPDNLPDIALPIPASVDVPADPRWAC